MPMSMASVMLWLWVFLLPLSWGYESQHLCQESQKEALVDFYNYSGFDRLNNLWAESDVENHTMCACEWFGVGCDQHGFIVSLNLHDPVNIGGAFPLNISRATLPWPRLFAKLDSLKVLRMEGFYHDRPLPQEIGLLSQSLTSLSLSECKLMPPLPITALSNLSKLSHLDLSMQGQDVEPTDVWPMYFTGLQIPRQLCNITTLQYLDLSGNGFGVIPSCIGLFLHLSHLDLSYNNLEGSIPQQMWATTSNLTYLDLSHNFLSGQISPRISNAEKMSSLYLNHNNLKGSIPDSVGELSELTSLHMSFNNLTGSIPASLGNLTKLRDLDLSGNMLSGEIPHQLGKLVNLADNRMLGRISLDLSGNQLSGRVPISLGQIGANASQQSQVDLSSNNLTGDLPWTLLTSSNIVRVNVHSNHLTGIAAHDSSTSALGSSVNTSTLTDLDAGANDFTGAIPLWIGHFSGLTFLDLSNNHLESGSFPDSSFPNFTLLELRLDSNNIQGPIPFWLSLQTSLQFLDLSFNQLEGAIPAWFWSLQLTTTDLSMNRLRGDIRLDAICAVGSFFNGSHNYFTKIQTPSNGSQVYNSCSRITLDLHSNQLSGLLPWHVGSNFTNSVFWESLSLADNSFYGSLPEFPYYIAGPIELDLSRNQLSGTIPTSVSWLGLQSLRLSSNNFSGEIPSSLCTYPENIFSFQQFVVLKLDSNTLSGSIPHELGLCMDTLTSLVLKDNMLKGSLPLEFSNLTKSLAVLDLSHNSLQSRIPSWIQHMQSLRVLILSHNAFSGHLPDTIWNTTQLQVLDLSSNKLRGNIPSKSLSAVVNSTKGQATVSLDLSDNALAGPIPVELGSLDGLIFLNLSHNHLKGSIPKTLGKLRQLNSLDLSNNELEGEIPREALCLLTLLSYVNLSYNELRGPIPRCNQWSTLKRQSFLGNRGLCGPQVGHQCSSPNSATIA